MPRRLVLGMLVTLLHALRAGAQLHRHAKPAVTNCVLKSHARRNKLMAVKSGSPVERGL